MSTNTRSRQKLKQRTRVANDSIINNVQGALRKDFIKSIIYPDEYSSRMPDELTQQTCLYRSVREFSLIANMDGTANAGRFSFAVKPILGSRNTPKQYQVGIINNSNGWPTDYASSDSYVTQNLYTDPQIDPMSLPLLTSPSSTYRVYSTMNGTNYASDGGVDGYAFPRTTGALGPVNTLALSTQVEGMVVDSIGPLSFAAGTTSTGITLGKVDDITFRHFPPGQYNVAPYINYLNTSTATVSGGQFFVISYNVITKEMDGLLRFQAATGTFQSGWLLGRTKVVHQYQQVYDDSKEQLIWDINFDFANDAYHAIGFGIYYPSGSNIRCSASTLVVNSTNNTSLPIDGNSGSLIKYRPVACSALVTCTLPDLTAGGNIVAYSAPSADIDNYYYNTSGVIGPYQEWQNLARNNKGINTHDGNFKDGCYVWTQPWDKNDTLMRTPSEALDYAYQGIIVSGQVNPTVQLSGIVEIGRIRICILYEYLTDNRLFMGQSCFGSSADLDWCLAYLAAQRHASQNNEHVKMLTDIVKNVANWVDKAIPVVQKGLTIASGIAKLVL